MFGLFGSYSRTQPVTIVASASSCNTSGCSIELSNQGGSAVTVVSASINGQTVSGFSAVSVAAGASTSVSVSAPSGVSLVDGQTVQVQLGLSNGATLSTTLVVG